MAISEGDRLSVTMVDVAEGREAEFISLIGELSSLMVRQKYGRLEAVRDENQPLRFYVLRFWFDAVAAGAFHANPAAQGAIARLYQIGRVIHVVNGVAPPVATALIPDERRKRAEADRRSGFERRIRPGGRSEGERRTGHDRRLGPRRVRDRGGDVDLVAAARRAREQADAPFSHFKVGAALESADGTVVTGCNFENASFGLTMCAERVAMFKALSEGHRVFTRIAIVADADQPTPPCGACRQILWEFGGNLGVELANLKTSTGKYKLADLLPHPFDARSL